MWLRFQIGSNMPFANRSARMFCTVSMLVLGCGDGFGQGVGLAGTEAAADVGHPLDEGSPAFAHRRLQSTELLDRGPRELTELVVRELLHRRTDDPVAVRQ